jgi:hypothetical protein
MKKITLCILLMMICFGGYAQKKNKKITDIDKLETYYDGNYFVVENCKLDQFDFDKYFKEHPQYQLISAKRYSVMEYGLMDTYVTSFKYVMKQPSRTGPQIPDAAIKAFAIGMGVVEIGMLGALYLKYAAKASNSGDYEIIVKANPSYCGSASSNYTFFNYGETCTVVAWPGIGHSFRYWSENGQAVSTDARYTFTVYKSRTLVANFF